MNNHKALSSALADPSCPPFAVTSLASAFPSAVQPFAGRLNHCLLPEPITQPAVGSRRRKLWSLPADFHWPLIGACFTSDELRRLVKRHVPSAPGTSDFVLHIMVSEACASRSALAELIHRQLDQRHVARIREFSTATEVQALKKLWQKALETGTQIPGALWASWTHPACNELLQQEIHGDIHMAQLRLAHQERQQAIVLSELQVSHRQMSRELEDSRRDAQGQRAARTQENQSWQLKLASLRRDLAGRDAEIAQLNHQLQTLQNASPSLSDLHTVAWRAELAESRLADYRARIADLEAELSRLHAATQRAALLPEAEPRAPCQNSVPASLAGKCVLCVGGRSGTIDSYRQVVEERGGRFLHHDGGQEENLHRINAALNAADLVICQAGCISHNAYWRVKAQCKRSGKPCLFVKNPGVSSFDRLVSDACTGPPAESSK